MHEHLNSQCHPHDEPLLQRGSDLASLNLLKALWLAFDEMPMDRLAVSTGFLPPAGDSALITAGRIHKRLEGETIGQERDNLPLGLPPIE